MSINHDNEYHTEHPKPSDWYWMECENSEGDELSMDITKTLEANKELLAHPFFNKANGSN